MLEGWRKCSLPDPRGIYSGIVRFFAQVCYEEVMASVACSWGLSETQGHPWHFCTFDEWKLERMKSRTREVEPGIHADLPVANHVLSLTAPSPSTTGQQHHTSRDRR